MLRRRHPLQPYLRQQPLHQSHRRRGGSTSLDDVIVPNLICSQDLRAFFTQYLGKTFRFKVQFQNWLRSNAGLTYRDALDAYKNL